MHTLRLTEFAHPASSAGRFAFIFCNSPMTDQFGVIIDKTEDKDIFNFYSATKVEGRMKLIYTIKLPAHPESFQIDESKALIFVNLPEANKLDVINIQERPSLGQDFSVCPRVKKLFPGGKTV